VDESKTKGKVGFSDYQNLFSFTIGTCAIIMFLLISLLAALCGLLPSYTLAKWLTLSYEE